MLHSLIAKTPSPIKSPKNDSIVYTKEGHIKDQFLYICQDLKIDPTDLSIKTLEDFSEPGVPENIQVIRYNTYEKKRQYKVEAIKALYHERHPPKKSKHASLLIPYGKVQKPGNINTQPFPSITGDLRRKDIHDGRKNDFFLTELAGSYSCKVPRDLRSADLTTKNRHDKGSLHGELSSNGGRRKNQRRSGSMDTLPEDGSVKGELMNQFEKSLEKRIKESERLLNASVIVVKKDQEYREKLREEWEIKAKKWTKAIARLKKERKMKIAKLEELDKVRIEQVSKARKATREIRKGKLTNLLAKLEESERKRNEIAEERIRKLTENSKTYQARQLSYQEKKNEMENSDFMSLSRVEEKLINSSMRKQQVLNNRYKPIKQSLDLEERQKMIREEEELEKAKTIQSVVNKMLRKIDFVRQEKKKRFRESSYSLEKNAEHTMRLNALRAQEKAEEKQFMQEVKQKDLLSTKRVENNRIRLSNYIYERRELRNNKTDLAKSNRSLALEINEKRLEGQVVGYNHKVENIAREKEEMKQKREKAQEICRGLFARRTLNASMYV